MKVSGFLSISSGLITLLNRTFTLIILIGVIIPSFSQNQKLSKQELRQAHIDSVFDHAESEGLDTKDLLRYEYYFSDPEKKQLEDLSEKLAKDSFETISLELKKDKNWHLRTMKNEIQSRETMYETEKKLRAHIYRFLVDEYSGFTISTYEINPLNVPDQKFGSYIHSLSDESLFNAAKTLIDKESYERSILAFQDCLDRHYKVDTSNFQLGNALVATNELVKGIEHWEKARNINPSYLEPFIKLGNLFFENSHFNRALSNFQKADALDPDNDEILYSISKCYLQLEKYNQSYEYASRALKLNSKNDFAKGVIDILNQPAIRKIRKKTKE